MGSPPEICQAHSGAASAGNPCSLSAGGLVQPFGDWQRVINVRPSSEVQLTLMNTRRVMCSHFPPVYHLIEKGLGDINLDYYPVYVTKLPIIDGSELAASDLFKFIRLNFQKFIHGSDMSFQLMEDPGTDRDKWGSDDPTGTLTHFKAGMVLSRVLRMFNPAAENMAVVCTEFVDGDHWTFSTLPTLVDGNHPVSGSREFGMCTRTPSDSLSTAYDGIPLPSDTTLCFYTRGADRCTTPAFWALSHDVFEGGDGCWTNLQNNVVQFIADNQGAATNPGRLSGRHDWPTIKAAYWQDPDP